MNLLVDTGSTNVVLNAGKYRPSNHSVNTNESFAVAYGTAQSNGTGSAFINGTLFQDEVTLSGLTVENQILGVADASESSANYPHDGIIGFGAQRFAADNATSWFHNLCDSNLVDECRFGLALNDATSGSLVVGTLDNDLFDGNLTTTPIAEEWFTYGDVVVGGQTLQKDAIVEFDSGSAAIVGYIQLPSVLPSLSTLSALYILTTSLCRSPTDAVTKLFTSLGAGISSELTPGGPLVTAQVSCSINASVGFRFPSSNVTAMNTSVKARIFSIPIESLLVPSTNGSSPNCTVAVVGQDFAELPGLWVLGQTFFQGKYIDHNLNDRTIGLANLKASPSNSSSGSSGSGSDGGSGSGNSASTNSAAASLRGSLYLGCSLLICYFAFGAVVL
ncbi:uncharacterized protein Z520_04070 [Fonsecaea multimorphosa CBS 102226]|uniref:Peptidase A1 domain-containing protein n=1 Tax=Fonsecaea multimorphosa CBS 102226 TaxID=1442371 RepID=A0A0D2KB78_9EURO|nr:uncharacterized protein Z520_04070 [Fonsecaea multimorphosa CBS 102226]KIY00385.1 hypothetical protein Z520_04070 [Fonsecaea multimorphosa CBS 102226]